ncbi:pickpocket protein 28-like [Uranotaenia lowii]|uniref:pickpocket protein 28-like n=1 Tax=Uranotaenia lowii TaxID=190385 RepID=UPI00247A0041|nr:pickpocket protein 28-like [Uranotaenia lowii]
MAGKAKKRNWTHGLGPEFKTIILGPPLYPREPIQHASDSPRVRQIWPKIKEALRDLIDEYCIRSTIHGINYIGSKRSILERFWWLVVFVGSIYGCSQLIQNVYRKWHDHPIILSYDETPLPVWKISFPAVTICPEAKMEAELFNFTDAFYRYAHGIPNHELDANKLNMLMGILQVCDSFFHSHDLFQGLYLTYNLSVDVPSVLKKLIPDCFNTVLLCRLLQWDCKNNFSETLTEDGICYTINGFSQNDMFKPGVLHNEYVYLNETKSLANWSYMLGYSLGASMNTYPIRGPGSGSKAAMSLDLSTFYKNTDIYCRASQGFKLSLHPPHVYPRMSKNFILLTPKRDMTISIRPRIIITAQELRIYTPEKRNCYFPDERSLMFFRDYEESNCELECLTNYTLKQCGCVRFSMPRTAATRVCAMHEMRCLERAEQSQFKGSNSGEDLANSKNCNCMPACDAIQYDAESTITTNEFGKTIALRMLIFDPEKVDEVIKKQISKVEIFFTEAQYITSERSEIFGMTDLIAGCGGILGLCLGVSFFSIVELLYYCLARPVMMVHDLQQHGDRYVSGSGLVRKAEY